MTTSKYTVPTTSYRYSRPPHPQRSCPLLPIATWLLSSLLPAGPSGQLVQKWPTSHMSWASSYTPGSWVLGIPFTLQLKTYTKQDSHHQHHRPSPGEKCPNWRGDPPSSPIRSMPTRGTSVSSVGSKGRSPLTPAATPWTCCSSQMSQGTARAGSCTTPAKVRLPGAPHWPARGQDVVGRKKAIGSAINVPSAFPDSHQVPPAQDPRLVHHHPGPAASVRVPGLLHRHLQTRLPAHGGKSHS